MKRVLNALAASFCGQVLARVTSLILVPLYLAYWSPVRYGEWLTLSASVYYLAMLDTGIQSAAVNRLTHCYSISDWQGYVTYQSTALMVYLCTAVLCTTATIAMAAFVPLSRALGLTATPTFEVTWAFAILGLYVSWSLPARYISSLYSTIREVGSTLWIANAQRLVGALMVIPILLCGGGFVPMAAVNLILLAAVTIFLVWHLGFRRGILRPEWKAAKLNVVRELLRPSMGFVLLMAGSLVYYQAALIAISSKLGGAQVAIFSLSRSLTLLIRQIVEAFAGAVTPDMTRLRAMNDLEQLRSVHRILIGVTGALSIAATGALWWTGGDLIYFWTHGRVQADLLLLRWLFVLNILEAPSLASAALICSVNEHARYSVAYLLTIAAGTALGAASLSKGCWTIPAALVVIETAILLPMTIRWACAIIGEPYARFLVRLAVWLLTSIAGALLSGSAIHAVCPHTVIGGTCIAGAFSLALVTVALWATWLTPADRCQLRRRVSSLRPKLALGVPA